MAKKKETRIEGFRDVDYEGYAMLECERCRHGWNTFDVDAAKAHAAEHDATDEIAEVRADTTENLAQRAQVTTEEEPSE